MKATIQWYHMKLIMKNESNFKTISFAFFNIILIFVRDSDSRKNKKKKKKWNGIRLWSIMTIPNQNDLKTFFSLENRALAIRDHSVTSSKFLRRIKWNGSELNWSDLKWFSIILKKKIRRDAFHRNFVHLQSINHIRRIEQEFWRRRTVAQPFWYAKACGKHMMKKAVKYSLEFHENLWDWFFSSIRVETW